MTENMMSPKLGRFRIDYVFYVAIFYVSINKIDTLFDQFFLLSSYSTTVFKHGTISKYTKIYLF